MITLLRAAGVAQVADIRRRPRSARHPHFDADTLRVALPEAGVGYHRLGDTLGGHRAEGYEAYMRTESFAHGLAALEDLAGRRPTAFLCAERDPWSCHRRFVARALEERGWRVVHLLTPGHAVIGETQPDLFPTPHAALRTPPAKEPNVHAGRGAPPTQERNEHAARGEPQVKERNEHAARGEPQAKEVQAGRGAPRAKEPNVRAGRGEPKARRARRT